MIIEWLQEASRSRFEQLDYIAQDNPLAAISQDEEIERQVAMLIAHPKMGRPGRVSGTRELVISSTPFVVVYRLGVKRIEILRFLHSSQQWPKARSGFGGGVFDAQKWLSDEDLDRMDAALSAPSKVADAFYKKLREERGGFGMDEAGNIVEFKPTRPSQ